MKHMTKAVLPCIPWLFLLLGIDAFAALLLWLADAQAFYSMLAVMVLATVLMFSTVSFILARMEQKREQAFFAFLHDPDICQEEALQKAVSPAYRDAILQLGQTLRDLQEANTELQMQQSDQEEYVESWAHEIKTPLSLLTLLLDNRREELPASVGFKLDHIRNRMQECVDQMLFYARLKGVRKDYLFEHLQVRLCLEEVLEDYRPLLHEQHFQVQVRLTDDTVYSDRRGLHFLLGQLISNSIKYCSSEPKLYISSFQTEKRYVLSIRDNGIGVRRCDLPYIFEKGFTGDSGEIRKKATGMGLYLAKELAEELNLTLQVRSEWGKGFEMQISFPVVHA